MKHKPAAFILILFVVCGLYYYLCVSTLAMSQVIGRQDNPFVGAAVNLFDFDTGLTRYDLFNLKRKSGYWQERTRFVDGIADPERKQTEEARLIAEMTEDPALKKIMKATLVGGFGLARSLVKEFK